MKNTIQLLDTTLRDGGLGLEDAFINGLSDKGFTDEERIKITSNLCQSNIDIVELGSIEASVEDKSRFGIYKNVESVSKQIPTNRQFNQMYVGLFRGPDTPIEDIPKWNPELVDGLRVIIRYSEFQKSLDFCARLAEKGYKVFVQPMLTMRYSDIEIDHMINAVNKMKAYALYFVDSYGYMDSENVKSFLEKFNQGLEKQVRIGFHAHNNMNLAYANTISFINQFSDRNKIIDACAFGMGQGAGNLQTELIMPYLLQHHISGGYNYNYILENCEIVERFLNPNLWGYSVTRLLPAIHKTAYKYAIALREKYHLSYVQINDILSQMPENLRHRYTVENTELLVNSIKKNLGEIKK